MRDREKAMILDETRWPGETLCLKKLPTNGEKAGIMGYSAFGVLASARAPLTVFLREDFKDTLKYDTVDALLDDGWIVD